MDWISSLMSRGPAVAAVPSLTPQHDPEHTDYSVPTLFGNDLSPCGLMSQIAYEKVVRRLRKMWLQRANTHPINILVLGICQWILDDYKAEQDESPPGRRKPWRHEEDFKYELCWAKYFVREPEALERRSGITEELEKQGFVEILYPVPKELHIYVGKNNPNKKAVLEMWKVWQRKNRGYALASNVHEGVDAMDPSNKEDLRDSEGLDKLAYIAE